MKQRYEYKFVRIGEGWRGDINADGAVNALDLTLFVADWLGSVES